MPIIEFPDLDNTRIEVSDDTSPEEIDLIHEQLRMGRVSSAASSVQRGVVETLGQASKFAGRVEANLPPALGAAYMGRGGLTPPTAEALTQSRLEEERRRSEAPAEREARVRATPAYRFGEQLTEGVAESAPVNPRYAGEFWSDIVPRGFGSSAAIVPAAVVSPLAAAGIYGGSAGEQTFEEAGRTIDRRIKEAQAAGDDALADQLRSDKERMQYAAAGAAAPLGAVTEAVLGVVPGAAGLIRRTAAPGTGILAQTAAKLIKSPTGQAVARAGVEGAAREAAQESLEQFGQNVIARNIYDPSRSLGEGVVESALAGAVIGGGTGASLGGFGGARRIAAERLAAQQQQVQDNLAKIKAEAERLAQRSGALPPTLPASPTPSAPTTATRGPTGAPAPVADVPRAGDSLAAPLTPPAPAAPVKIDPYFERVAGDAAIPLEARKAAWRLAKGQGTSEDLQAVNSALASIPRLAATAQEGPFVKPEPAAPAPNLDPNPALQTLSPTPSAPTTATRGPTGAPAPTVDAPLAGESPLPPSAPAAPAAPAASPTADTGTPFDVIERMTQDEYADWIAKGGGNVNGQGAIYKELVKRPEFRGGRSASTSDLTEASRLLRALENTEGFSDSSEGWTFRRFGDDKTKNPDGTRSKAYLTLDNWKSLTPEALKALANQLEVAGYQGQLKVPGAVPFGAWRLAEGFDNVVAHGRTPKDVELFAEIAGRLFPKAKLSYGLDPKGTSHTDALASAANKSRIALKTGKGSVPFTPLPRQFFTPAPQPPSESKASVPVMITRQMEADLRNLGYPQSAIDAMRPQEAGDILAQKRAFKSPPPSGSALKATLDLAFAEMDAAEQKELDDLRAKRDSGKILTAKERRSLQVLEERRARDAAEAAAAAQPPTPTPTPTPAPNASAAVSQQPGVPVQPAQAPQGGVSPEAGAGDSAVGAKAKRGKAKEAVAPEVDEVTESTLPDVVPSAPAGDLTAEERAKLDTYRELEKAGQLSDTGRARMQALEARLRPGGKAPAQPAPVQPVAQPAPAPAAPLSEAEALIQASLASPSVSEEDRRVVESLVAYLKENPIPGVSEQTTLANVARAVAVFASGGMEVLQQQVAQAFGLPPLQKVALSALSFPGQIKTGGLYYGRTPQGVRTLFVDLFALASTHRWENPKHQARLNQIVLEELWHPIIRDAMRDTNLAQNIWDEMPANLRDKMVAAWGAQDDPDKVSLVAEEYTRALLQKFGKLEPATEDALMKATEELTNPNNSAELVAAILGESPKLQKFSKALPTSFPQKLLGLFTDLKNRFLGKSAPATPALVKVFDAAMAQALKEAKAEAPRNRLKAAKVREAKAAAPAPVKVPRKVEKATSEFEQLPNWAGASPEARQAYQYLATRSGKGGRRSTDPERAAESLEKATRLKQTAYVGVMRDFDARATQKLKDAYTSFVRQLTSSPDEADQLDRLTPAARQDFDSALARELFRLQDYQADKLSDEFIKAARIALNAKLRGSQDSMVPVGESIERAVGEDLAPSAGDDLGTSALAAGPSPGAPLTEVNLQIKNAYELMALVSELSKASAEEKAKGADLIELIRQSPDLELTSDKIRKVLGREFPVEMSPEAQVLYRLVLELLPLQLQAEALEARLKAPRSKKDKAELTKDLGLVKNELAALVQALRQTVPDQHFYTLLTYIMSVREGGRPAAPPAQATQAVRYSLPVALPNDLFSTPPSENDALAALYEDKSPLWGAHRGLKAGTPVGVRIDIPAYLRRGVFVQTVHKPATPGNVGDRIGYDNLIRLSGPVRFFVKEGSPEIKSGALAIKEGRAKKHPIATVEGNYSRDRSIPRDINSWTPVGMNPVKHSYFYDKRTGEPVVGGSESYSVGNTVFVKDPVYGVKSDFRYSLPVAQGDEEYLRLAQDPVGNREALQRMVDEAAKKAGYVVGPVFHGTTADKINAFRRKLSGIWVANDVENAQPGSGDAARTILRLFVDPRSVDYSLTTEELAAWRFSSNPLKFIRNVRDRTQANTIRVGEYATVVFDPTQIKSADPVTYDDNGNVIPLSQRFQPTEPDIRYSLPVAQGDEDLGAAETRLRGAFTRILDQVLLPARERDEDLYTNTLYQAARTRLKELERKVDDYQLSVGQDPVSLASDEFEDIVASAEFQNSISSLSTGLLGRLGSLMQDRANVLEERAARQLASDMARLEDAQALLEFWQTVDQTAPGVAAIVKRLQNKAEKLANAVKDPPADRLERAMQIKRSEDTKIDRAAAARAQSGPLLEWLRSAGSAEVVSEILAQEPFNADVVLTAQGPRTTAAVGANAPGMSGALEPATPNLGPVPAYSLGALVSKAINMAGAKAMALRELLDSFDRQRRAANAALASKEAQALAREIVQISQEIKQAHANLGQGRLDLRAVLRTIDGRTNDTPSMLFTRKELQELANLDEAAEQSAAQLVSLIQDNRNPALAGAVLDLLARPSKGAASPAESAERVPSTAELAKLLAKELGLSENTLNVLLGAMAKSNPVREAFSALVDRKLGVPLIYELNYLESATKAFNEAAEKFRATPVAEDAKKEFQAALDARDAAINRVLVPLRNRLQSQGANVRGLESRLLAKLIQQRTLQVTAEAFETIASDPEFNRARFGIEQETADEFSLQQLVRWDKARGGYQFSPFGLTDPKTGQRIKDDLGSDGFFWSPSDPFSTSRDQVLDYMRKAQNLLDLNAAATLAYETDPTANPSPAQLGFDARMMTALQLMMDHDATERLVTMELLDPELAKGSVGFMESWWLSRWIWRAWINTRGILGGRGLAVLEAFAYALPGRIGPVLRQSMGKFDRLAADLNGVFAEAQRPKDSKDPGLGRTLRKAMASHGVDSYSVPALPDGNGGFVPLSVEMYREKVFNYLMSRGRTSGKFDVSVGADIPLSGGMKVTQEDLDLLEADSKLNRNVYGLLGRSGRADRFIIEGKFSRKPQANWRYYSNRRLASRRVNGFLDRVAAVEKKTPGVSLAKGDAAAVDFWSAADNFDLVLSHIVDALSDPAEDAVVHRPGVRAAMAEAAPTIESATNLTEVVAQLTNTAAAKKAGLSSDQLRAALNEELDQLFNNAKAMFTAKQSGELSDELTLDATRRVSVSADNQFTTPFGPRKLPSRLYDYGALTQPELAQFQRNASKLEMIDLINALQFAVTELRTLKLKYREGDPAAVREFKARFTDEGEVDHLINQGEQLQDTLLTYGANGGSGKVGWLISRLHTAALLGKPIVMLFNAQTAPIMFAEQMRKIDVGGFMKPRRRAAELLGRTNVALGRSVAAYTAGKLAEVVADVAEKAGVKRANLPGLIHLGIKLVDRERMMRSNVAGAGGTDRLGFWTEFYRAIDALQVEGMGAEIPERYRSWEEWLRRKAIDPLSATGSALLKKLNTGSGDLRINASIMVMMDWLGETYAGVAERYLNRLQAEGKLDLKTVKGGQEVLLRPGINVAQLAVKPSDFGDSLGNVSNQAKLQRLRQWLQRAGFPSPEQMFLDYHARRQADINASIFTTDQLRMLMQTMVSDTNAPTLSNRPMAFFTDGNTAELFKLMGYGFNAMFQAANAPVRVRRTMDQPAERYAKGRVILDPQQLYWLAGSAITLALFGSLADGLRELWRRHIQNRGRSRDTIFDADVYTDPRRVGRMVLRSGAAATPFPYISDALNVLLEADPFGRGFDPSSRPVIASLVTLLIGESVSAWTALKPVLSGEFGEAATRLGRQATRLGMTFVPWGAEAAGQLARAGVALEGPIGMMQQNAAAQMTASLQPGMLKPGGVVASAKNALTPSPFRGLVPMMIEAQIEKNPAKYQEAMGYFVRALQEKNAERIKRGQEPISLEEQLRASSEGYVPFKYLAPGATQTEIASAMAQAPEASRQAILQRQAMVSNIRGGEEVRLGVQPRGQAAGGGGGGGGALPTSSLRLPGIGRVSVGGGGGGGGSRLSRSRRRRPRLTLGGRGRNLSRLRVRRLRSPRNRLLRRRRA